MLNIAIENFENYYDAYIYRGKLYIKEKRYEKAVLDFQKAIQINPDKGVSYMNKADCLKFMGQHAKASEFYTKAMDLDSSLRNGGVMKRANTYFDSGKLEEALTDIEEVLKQDPQNSEACYFKGTVLKAKNNSHEALLQFEQTIKHNTSKKAVGKSLAEIAKIYIEQRDFYAAFHTLNRSEYLDIEQGVLDNLKLFTEGVIFLMKRKFPEAMENFEIMETGEKSNKKQIEDGEKKEVKEKDVKESQQEIEKNKSKKNIILGPFLKPLFHQYRAYGYFCLGNHQAALFQYLQLDDSITEENDSCNSFYNRYLCEGILAINTNQYEDGIELFEKSQVLLKQKVEPCFYKGVTLISMAFEVYKEDDVKKTEYIISGLKQLDLAVSISPTNANLFYYRALIRCMLGYFNEGIQDIDSAIEKSEDNVPKYFFLRGHVFGVCQNFQQAVHDLSTCIQLDENFAQAYLERSKNYHYVGDSNQAFADLQKYIALKPNDPEIHTWAGNLLFHCGALEDAIKAYSHSDQIDQDLNLLAARSKCFLQLKDIESAYQDLSKVVAQCQSRSCAFDFEVMSALRKIIQSFNNNRQRGDLEQEEEEKQKQSQIKLFREQVLKMDKVILSEVKQGRMFRQMDIVFYKAVCKFYSGKYEEAADDFAQAQFLKIQVISQIIQMAHLNNQQDEDGNPSEQNNNIDLEEEERLQYSDLSDSFSVNQCFYNMAMCNLMIKNYKGALINMESIHYDYKEVEEKENFKDLIQFLKQEIQIQSESIVQIEDLKFEENKIIDIFPESKQKFSNKFDSFMPLFLSKQKLTFKLSFCLPKVEAPPLYPEYDTELVQNFKIGDVENKPEAPWIRRNVEGVIFTDNLQIFESLDLKTEERYNTQDEKSNLMEELQGNSNFEEEDQEEKEDQIKKMKFNLQLDMDIEQKLNKLMKKKQEQQ